MTSHEDGHLSARVRDVVAPLLGPMEMELIDVEVTGPGSRPLIRVIVDTADLTSQTGVDVDDIAAVSRQLGDLLDEDLLFDQAYTLEVTSPGADRPLTGPRDFARNIGRDVRVHRRSEGELEASDDAEPLTGTLLDVDDDQVTLDTDGTEVTIAFADLDHGTIVLPW